MSRLPALDGLARTIAALPAPARVAIDGVDAAGKTTLADELAARLPGCVRISADSFLRPAAERHRLGRESSAGYYRDSFDHERLRAAVLDVQRLALVDGIFLFRPELNDLWNFRVFVHVELEEALRRGVQRDGPGTERAYRRRYMPAQRAYLASVRPAEQSSA